MKKALSVIVLLALVTLSVVGVSSVVSAAEEGKLIGVISKLENKGSFWIATLKDNKSGKQIAIVVKDQLTMDKFKDHRIADGDEIRCKYEVKDGQNVSKLFRKTAGC